MPLPLSGLSLSVALVRCEFVGGGFVGGGLGGEFVVGPVSLVRGLIGGLVVGLGGELSVLFVGSLLDSLLDSVVNCRSCSWAHWLSRCWTRW